MTFARALIFGLASMGLGLPATAADFSDPTWPCIQRKVGALSMGLMWPVQMDEDMPLDPALRAAADQLAETLALRRIDLETAEGLVGDFADTHEADMAVMSYVFSRVFRTLNTRRTALIEGIGEYSLSQIARSERIDETRARMDTLMAAEEPDFDEVDRLEEQVDWDERIYTDRQKSLTYVCETPVLLEKRLYAVAQMLTAAAKD
ncbi:hypothetical protein ACOXXX_12300 [Thalassococcus sp. BH17M4-6]|uniref:hypothetical protein n=1 Tax=Thalassococcus sp. BH17M4-6 TaxID=3413148 RepID=UPI003BCD227D